MRIAFAGIRHFHIQMLYDLILRRGDVEIVAACEADPAAREQLAADGKVTLTHADYPELLAEVDCDAVAVGDYYGRRGEVVLAALHAGRHVISDKPICTRAGEQERIAALASEKNLCVGCQLDMRDNGRFRTMRRLIREGAIGEVHTITFTGQHPLMFGSRPGWYFEEDKQGGTINDIAIHAIDAIPWMTGRQLVEIISARVWNARLTEVPFFQDGAQMMLRMDNAGGVLGDVSYLAPDRGGYEMPQYWRTTCHGNRGVLEVSATQEKVFLGGCGDEAIQWLDPDPTVEGGYFDAFLREIAGESKDGDLTTRNVLEAARITLAIQQAAESGRTNVAL